jgi:hypothetical protein
MDEEQKEFDDNDMYGGEDPYGDEGDDFGFGDYGDEMGGFGDMDAYGAETKDENIDAEIAAIGSSKKEEQYLLEHAFKNASSVDILAQVKEAIVAVGQ